MAKPSEERVFSLPLQLGFIALVRLLLNTGLRMVYPFLPALARGMGVPLADVFRLVTIRNLAGFVSPLFGPLSERFGRKPVVVGAVVLFSLGCFLVVLWPAYWPLGLTLSIIALTKVIYDPAVQAYVGDTVPYQKRGRAIAVTELAWAGALLVGAPTVGFIIQRQGWQAPFFWLGLSGIAATLLLWYILPRGDGRASRAISLRQTARVVRQHPVIWAATAYIMLVMAANETFFIVYGGWMEESFNLSLTNLGLASGIIGGAEITGEIFVGLAVDRFGKRPVVITTGLLSVLTYLFIPYTSTDLTGALFSLFALFLFFEITVVGSIPLLTEIVPAARGVVMSVTVAASAVGRALGALWGPAIWAGAGFAGNSLAAAVITVMAVVILARWVREGAMTVMEIGD